ncbi:MAG TPA: cyclic nucleotide-gated ion channel [Burkholderiales bacterium]|nr:cyclic nucleotide-gated ion channel [Burkholderiales bacterium]
MAGEHDHALRARVHHLLAREEGGSGGLTLRTFLVLLIAVSVTAAVLKSVPEIGNPHGALLDLVLVLTTIGFAIEYVLRVWTAPESAGAAAGSSGAARERLRYVASLPGVIDLMAAIPFALAPHVGLNLDWLDIVPIFKLLRHMAAFQFLVEAVYSERRVLGSAAVLMLALLVFQSSLVYFFEREAQPEKFGSIPAAMWWGIVTLTTVGYGDVTPVTPWGRIAGGLTAVMGLCMFAIPVGIIASAFVEAVRRREFVDTWNLVAKVPLFRTLDAARIAAVAGVLRARRAERGERLIRKGDAADSMYFIVSGEVEVDTETGAARGRLVAGDFFGEIALIAERTRTATVTALAPCKLLLLHKDDFESFMEAHPDLRNAVREAAKKRLHEIGG